MVSWTNLFPADPQGGQFYAYGRAAAVSFINEPWGQPNVPYYLSSPGAVDANIGTRIQYAITEAGATSVPSLTFWGPFIIDATDVANAAGRFMTATGYLAAASAFAPGVTPTIAQIRTASIYRARLANSRTTAGNLKSFGDILITEPLPPNTKYWFALVPSFVTDMTVPPTASSDVPMADINTIGRGLSIWSNRTPAAPKITSPAPKTTAFAGSDIELKFEPQGPDRIASFPGDGGPNDLDDLAGVQVQYAPVPTDENPDPTWEDLSFNMGLIPPFADGPGWYIDQSNEFSPSETYGIRNVWKFRKGTIQCGGPEMFVTGGAYLPSGDWQIRMRTFDYGHPYPNSTGVNPWLGANKIPPLGDDSGDYTPDTYPAANTSPWSTTVRISVSEQVPPPVPLSPTNSVATIDGTDLSLVWQYRNTYVFPTPQAHRTVQIRRFGETEWTTLADDDSSLSYLDVTGYELVSGNQYQWRVRVSDAGPIGDGWGSVTSDWSQIATFWRVPPPDSGEVIIPGELIEGATLGCGTHTVQVFKRGGLEPRGEIRNVYSVEWNRTRDDISVAEIVVKNWDIDCGNLLASLDPWAYEVVLFRDNGYSVDRVWEGPISLLTYRSDRVIIQAKDVMNYTYRRIVKQPMVDTGDSPTAGSSVVERAARVLQNVFAPDDPNVLDYLTILQREDDAKQYRSLPAYSRTGFEEVDDMAANAGLDYVAVGRRIIVWGTKHRIGTLPEFTDADLGNAPIVSVYGMSGANVYAVSDGNGVYGVADRLDDEGKDDYYGLVEMLSSTWSSEAGDEAGTFTEAGLTEVRESFAQSAERSIDDRYPMPVVVRVPDNTRVNPDTVISIQHLVPGVIIPLRSTGTLRTVVASQKLDSVKVVEKDGEETITVTMSPFSRDDTEVGAEE